MKKLLALALIVSCLQTKAQDDTLKVVNWNIEWFGSYTNGPGNEELQEQNVVKVLRYLGADIYALNEVVDTMRLRRVRDSLGSNWAYVVSSFGSIAPSPVSPNWISAQKLAFLYKKDVFSNIQTRAMLSTGGNAYFNFASGRYPYLFNANVNKNGKKRNISFINIHAKAGASANDYNRRREGAMELKDTMDLLFANHPTMLLGDFNDDLYTSIVWGYNTSSYDVFVKDSSRSKPNYYHCITLPLGANGEQSTISYSNVIDHQVINKRFDSMYIPNSADVRTDVVNAVPEYINYRNTSDHFPVSSKFLLIAGDTSVVVVNPPPPPPPPVVFTGFKAFYNPSNTSLAFQSGKTLKQVEMVVYDVMGTRVWQHSQGEVTSQLIYEKQLPYLASGIYFLVVHSKQEIIRLKFFRQ